MPSSSYMKKKWGYRIQRKKPLIAIVIDWENGSVKGRRYHTQDITRVNVKFENRMRQLYPNATHINYYKKGNYYRRSYLQEKKMLTCNSKLPKKTIPYIIYPDVLTCMMYNSLY